MSDLKFYIMEIIGRSLLILVFSFSIVFMWYVVKENRK